MLQVIESFAWENGSIQFKDASTMSKNERTFSWEKDKLSQSTRVLCKSRHT